MPLSPPANPPASAAPRFERYIGIDYSGAKVATASLKGLRVFAAERSTTDEDYTYVDFVRDGAVGNGAARAGDTRWKRLTEKRAGSAKSVFHFDVQGSVAKSTHAGLPWLRYLRQQVTRPLHFWPFDGWDIPAGSSAVAEVYPRLWNRQFPPAEGRTADQHDAWVVAEWLRAADLDGRLAVALSPQLDASERSAAEIEGWILGVE